MIAAEAVEGRTVSPWESRLREAESAAVGNDPREMVRTWQATFLSARCSESWESMVAVGDLAVAIGSKLGLPLAFALKARQSYLLARARAQHTCSSAGITIAEARLDGIGEILRQPRS
jgi:hypothetical protein